jgi:hypothetical protein
MGRRDTDGVPTGGGKGNASRRADVLPNERRCVMWMAVKCLGALALFWLLVSLTYGVAPWAAGVLILLGAVGRVQRA